MFVDSAEMDLKKDYTRTYLLRVFWNYIFWVRIIFDELTQLKSQDSMLFRLIKMISVSRWDSLNLNPTKISTILLKLSKGEYVFIY